MRVAVVTRYFPSSEEPWAGHSAYQTLRFLAQRMELKVFYPEITYPKILTPPSVGDRAIDLNYTTPDVAVKYIPYPALPAVSRPANGWSASRSIFADVKAYRPEIILNYIIYPDGYAALRVAMKLGVPVVVTAIGSDLNRISDPMSKMHTQRVLREADYVITVSGALRKVALGLGADPVRSKAVLNGCDTSIFHPRERGEARRLLKIEEAGEAIVYVGRLDVDKGLRELIEAMARLQGNRPQTRCYIVGDGPDKAVLGEAITKHGVGERVTLMPSCRTEQVALWMAAADLVTLPSYREGCPNVVVEALAAGRPVVASDVGGIPELMDSSCGRLVPVKDAEALAVALEEVLVERWDPTEISGRHSRSWKDVAEDMEEILEQVLAVRRS